MHGNEPAPRRILTDLRDGQPVHDLNLWVVPVYNPDGLAHHTRKNAHGVDPNRNYPYKWARLDRQLLLGPQAGLRARDPRDDEVPVDGEAGVRAVLPPAAARRRHHRAPGVLPPGRQARSTCR